MVFWHVLAGIALKWQRIRSKSKKQHEFQLSIKIQIFFISQPSNCITIQRAYSCVMYLAVSKLGLGTHLGGKRKKIKKLNQNIVRRFFQSQYLWSRNSPGGIHAVSVPQAVPLLPQFFSFTPLNQQITSQRQLMCQGLVQPMWFIFTARKGQSSCSRTIFSVSSCYSHSALKAHLQSSNMGINARIHHERGSVELGEQHVGSSPPFLWCWMQVVVLGASSWELLNTSAHCSRQHYVFALEELVLMLSCQ